MEKAGAGDSMPRGRGQHEHPSLEDSNCHSVYSHLFQEANGCWCQPELSILLLSGICVQMHRGHLPIPPAEIQKSFRHLKV